MTRPSEQQAPAGPRSHPTWDVYCPNEGLNVIVGFPSEAGAEQGAAEHNAQFNPPHAAGAVNHTPSGDDPPHLNEVQREAFKQNEADFAELEKHRRSVRQAAEVRLRDADYDPGGPLYCYICTCSSFLAPDNDGGLDAKCQRQFCRHTSMEHA
ncbi:MULTISPECIES: hypothetical protein [unclassified Streptomyces]|uniref:hypothetical protein n=1 Tax=unclassified Streptomyces TaxID=2593676 RepID=UPI000F4EE030|nr:MULTISPECIES: hypothetical protein [unclassified Streptomyces]MDH6455401.1 hypothetical protein [Streptomyces sp. SAI-119]MDH6494046.1 hypothetical protein [Streptomyces sp. SAI-149]